MQDIVNAAEQLMVAQKLLEDETKRFVGAAEELKKMKSEIAQMNSSLSAILSKINSVPAMDYKSSMDEFQSHIANHLQTLFERASEVIDEIEKNSKKEKKSMLWYIALACTGTAIISFITAMAGGNEIYHFILKFFA